MMKERRKPWKPRPSQIPPAGDWRIWLIVAGRGFGKTRVGSEWTIASARDYSLVNIIGATADDARDIMIEGESGILACAPESFRPTYLPSKRRLEWPNGARTLIFTADEPERLRGKQHMRLWGDELACLIAGTFVQMASGPKPIEQVRPGERVYTRNGLQTVTDAWRSSPHAPVYELIASNGETLIGTPNHPVWIEGEGFIPLQSIHPGDILRTWEQSKVLSGMASDGGSTEATIAIAAANFFIESSTERCTGQSLWALISTTRTAIRPITTHRTSRPFLDLRTFAFIVRADGSVYESGVLPCSGNVGPGRNRISLSADSVELSSPRRVHGLDSAPIGVERQTAGSNTQTRSGSGDPNQSERQNRLGSAPSAAGRSRLATRERSAVPACAGTVTVRSLRKLADRQAVYNLSVEQDEEYYANGILVHNSWRYPEAYDQAMLGLRLGADPRALLTTTPKPTRIIRELLADEKSGSGRVAVSRGSTYENRENLAPAFIEQIIARYEGTRLGRQELQGEYLDDTPGALWTRALIVQRQPPDLRRVVVAIDPAVTATEDSDETGIIVAGVGIDGNGYVLADRSCRLSPDGWARRAIAAFDDFKADRIVAESNQGGDMIEQVLRTIAPRIPYTKVHASRGKRTRAEPVAALYEQSRVFHAEAFADLEDQLCGWTPDSGESPDRLDALVWALTWLMVVQEPSRRLLTYSGV